MKTTSLRRYKITDGQLDAYVSWFQKWAGLRADYGFTVEQVYVDRGANEFLYTVSAEGDQQRFEELEEIYHANPHRADAFKDAPDWVVESSVSFIEPVAI